MKWLSLALTVIGSFTLSWQLGRGDWGWALAGLTTLSLGWWLWSRCRET
jgi:hypothetical protein